MNKCPRCFCALDDDHYAWTVSPQANRRRYSDPVASAYVGAEIDCGLIYSVIRPPGYRRPLLSASDAAVTLEAPVVEICPVCHAVLPDGWRQGHAICLAIAATPGKSTYTYLAVLIQQAQLLCECFGASMEPVQSQAPHHREPLIFTMGIRDGIRRFLVIRDIAGEDLESGDMQAPRFRHFANADAVFFTFGPLRVKSVRDQLHDLLRAESL